MKITQRKKLLSIAESLRALADDLNDLIKEMEEVDKKQNREKDDKGISSKDYDLSIEGLRSERREGAFKRLEQLKQKELADLFVQLGGPSRDRKKPKSWLIERILWQLFDFQSGHDILKNNR